MLSTSKLVVPQFSKHFQGVILEMITACVCEKAKYTYFNGIVPLQIFYILIEFGSLLPMKFIHQIIFFGYFYMFCSIFENMSLMYGFDGNR